MLGALILFFCGIVMFAPAPETPEEEAAAIAGLPAVQPIASASASASAKPASPKPAKTKPEPSKTRTEKATPKPASYANCAEVEDAGKAPIMAGQPGFQEKFDRDGDGVGCEDDAEEEPATEEEESSGGTDPRFSTCAKANAAGYGPYEEGVDPEYDWYRDRDGDGMVCE
ncbi:hypothetical protein ACTI_31440 [Actinoplanes sp. OR16]|uniref:excalibur calcium-binding domain-containing protein n=1 Tax=Actinoplanes sp. OR16 TaxID=946334 RepID=UPI000F6DAF8E|nr:excalibur calcium-binding domain-containing protein [Actinoplanes sp. OR16]BBH66459.1 hypothetical protein ACTI_31440 [Actinoplanes sp. OR16]